MSEKNLRMQYLWIVNDTNEFIEGDDGVTIESSDFTPKESNNERFKLVMRKKETEAGFCTIILWFRNCVTDRLSIPKNHMITIAFTHPTKGRLLSETNTTVDYTWFQCFTFRLIPEDLKSFTFDGKFMILCEVGEYGKDNSALGEKSKSIIYEPYMNNDSCSDVQILIGEEKFAGHKLVLSAHSPVFHNMFSHEMKESISNQVEIKEMDPKIFTEVLRFMYAGKVENLDDTAQEILIAADRYEIHELKLMCEKFLISKINLENIIELLDFADKYNADYLKNICFENFVVKDLKTFVELEGYQDFLKSHATLLAGWFTEIGLKGE